MQNWDIQVRPNRYDTDKNVKFIILNACQVRSVESVSMIKSILSIFYEAYGAVCIQHTHFAFHDCENTCILPIIIKSEV